MTKYDEERPWWSIHRPRPEIIAAEANLNGVANGWANYCLMPNWGSGGAIIVGLAPAKSSPAQGLNALIPPNAVPAAYVSAVLNSTIVQEVGDSIPPGYLRKSDLSDLTVPDLDAETIAAITEASVAQADLVQNAAINLTKMYPELRDGLRSDPTVASAGFTDLWTPAVPAVIAVKLAAAPWVGSIATTGNQNQRITHTEIVDDAVLGLSVVAYGSKDANRKTVTLAVGTHHAAAVAVCDFIAGQGCAGTSLKQLDLTPTHYSLDALHTAWNTDHAAVAEFVHAYRNNRSRIDDMLAG